GEGVRTWRARGAMGAAPPPDRASSPGPEPEADDPVHEQIDRHPEGGDRRRARDQAGEPRQPAGDVGADGLGDGEGRAGGEEQGAEAEGDRGRVAGGEGLARADLGEERQEGDEEGPGGRGPEVERELAGGEATAAEAAEAGLQRLGEAPDRRE